MKLYEENKKRAGGTEVFIYPLHGSKPNIMLRVYGLPVGSVHRMITIAEEVGRSDSPY